MAHRNVLFLDQNANERGTSVATYTYAKYNEEILGNTSIILVPQNAEGDALELYKSRFSNVHRIESLDDMGAFTRNADFCYVLTSGIPPPFNLEKAFCRIGIHCVFTAHCPHGDIYFLLMNTKPFYEHPRVIYLPKTFSFEKKARFVNTCDAMIHARREGETFGLAVGEFSLRQKPVITWFWSIDRHPINTLKDNGVYYRTPLELLKVFKEIKRGEQRPDCYSSKYNPERVIRQFERVFLS